MGAGIGLAHEQPRISGQSSRRARRFPPFAKLAPLICLSGCAGPFSTLEPEGPAARGAATLWWIMLGSGVAIFMAVWFVLVLALLRPGALRRFGTRRTILWGGLIVPTFILTALVVAALALGERLLALPREDMPPRIEVVARQWSWEFRYPDGTVGEGLLRMPAGQDVDFVVTSEDVIHSFWIPRLGGKIDAIPGHRNIIRLRADRPGVFGGICAEYCGIGHAIMPFTVEAYETRPNTPPGSAGNGS
ncbi:MULTISPECIES: cytochrome c oxidase subunit II [unclassified Chelatococcus]|nr:MULTISPECIES: cytochrome c oxidase subunit II [unclassified Chelatococcus]MBS7742618.1 cytochrome c oxidase subunit II [Chelatococcus sp. HY11]MBX3542264.1 cytochrome c oxidase subunit II [Chelatococcus sp.]CAH1655385.1 Cytochrome c oxidase polypeptide II [Hyphomicrobiales bacterium]CAH1695457.1 Cytochrome c oxidase polypeptide II [Hyphomicrobiales bacterium]